MLKGKFPLPVVLAAAAMLVSSAIVPAPARAADVPYWVSLRKDESNMRVGPGLEYRINWIYRRKALPLKVLRVMGGWRLVEDPDGARGWMLARFLARTHTGIVRGQVTAMREANDGSGQLLWRVAPGVIGKLGDCSPGWCRFDIDGRAGYIPAPAVWGAGAP
ncbi:SH3 domain-containing protein [Novosphingobium lentum]|uniref:SH3 domain-containing protein n=1 Tax=Novosphingobium lentum TaxID=145287 RepID=UPI000A68EBE1|nr:SH3 domain-containing protein [Novosphingobium lentum]